MRVRDFADGSDVDTVLVVRARELRRGRDGSERVELELGDRTGTVTALLTGDADAVSACAPGAVVRVAGRCAVDARAGRRLTLRALSPARPDEYDERELLDGPPLAPEVMERDLRELVATVREPHLRALLQAFFGPDSPVCAAFCAAPAAKYYHQAYRHGLLEHCLSVAQGVSAIAATFPGIDRDVAVTGALLHDIGKLEAYTQDPWAIEMTDAGKLQGEIPLGYYRIRRAIEDIPSFPPDLATAVLHIVLSHHGALEHGSPVVPCTREATLVHMIDNLGGRLGSFDRLEKELPAGSRWSAFDRALGAGAYFARAAA